MDQIKVLAIGNSFSQDAVEYLREISACSMVDVLVGNLYIGGCSLEQHWRNVKDNSHSYNYFRFGENRQAYENSAILETLQSENWDFVTFQQASYVSGQPATYQPYLIQLSEFVKKNAPGAMQLIHQTWAYEIDSDHGGFASYNNDQSTMFSAIKDAYAKASQSIGARLIPCGEAMQLARNTKPFDYQSGGKSLCRDGFHASIPHGRFLLGAVWFEVITQKSILENTYLPLDETDLISREQADVLRKCAHEAVKLYK